MYDRALMRAEKRHEYINTAGVKRMMYTEVREVKCAYCELYLEPADTAEGSLPTRGLYDYSNSTCTQSVFLSLQQVA